MREKPLRILYVAPFWPRRGADGAPGFRRGGSQIRLLGVLHALQQMGAVDAVVLDDNEEGVGELLLEPGLNVKVAYTLQVEARPNQGPAGKLRWMLDPRRDYPNGCGVGDQATEALLNSVRGYDLVWFFKLRSPDLFPNRSWPRSVLDIDDVPSTSERVNLRLNAEFGRRLQAVRRMISWRRRERLLGDRFNVLAVCSEQDRQYLQELGVPVPLHVIPNAFATPSQEPVRRPAAPPRVGFIGLLQHPPNAEGLRWFTTSCWPRIKRECPSARLRLIGMGSDGPGKPDGPDVDGLGWVADPAEEISTWSVMVVPIRTGGGTRVKIVEGFANKCPIVSTSLGALGYEARDGHNMYLADSPESFATACVRALREPEISAEMAERAWCDFLKNWTWDAIRHRVWAAAEDCLRINQRT